jgi:YggT family protein
MSTPDALLFAACQVIKIALKLYMWVIIIGAIMSWLVAFGVINMHNRFVQMASDFIYRATEPVLRPIRRLLPPTGGVDLSPMVLILLIYFTIYFLDAKGL